MLSREAPLGLTHSWNQAYRFAQCRGYKHLFLANNDVLVPKVSMCNKHSGRYQ